MRGGGGGLWKQEGASGNVLAFFCPLLVLGFKYRIGPVGDRWVGGGGGRGGEAWHIFITLSQSVSPKKN